MTFDDNVIVSQHVKYFHVMDYNAYDHDVLKRKALANGVTEMK